ncbi:hypothetical protein OH77DRAFT_1507186 [Trametes cingulata]|nr:hypothetical protein OH77DRAFT_1507186 [Trametes cingulata]
MALSAGKATTLLRSASLVLTAVLSSTLQEARTKGAEKAWLTLATCTLLGANVPSAVAHLYRFATRDDVENAATRRELEEALDKAALMREAILKGISFLGVPRTILSMGCLHDTLEDDVKDHLRDEPLRILTPGNVTQVLARGEELAHSIYDSRLEELIPRFGLYHPDFPVVILQSYATIFAPLPGGDAVQGNLNRALSSVVAVACLRAEGGVGELLNGHVLGLLRARDEPGLSEGDYWVASDEGAEWVLRTVDAILDVVKPDLGEGSV